MKLAMILALHQPTVTYLRQLLATFIAEVTFFDDFPAMRAGCHFFILHSPHPPFFLNPSTSASSSSKYSTLLQPSSSQTIMIKRLTADGCDYLDNIRNDTIWNKTKEAISNVGGTCALDIVKSIAGKIILSQAGI